MDWKNASIHGELTKIPERWLHLHYYEALNILFRFENSLRVFVYVILKCELQEAWDNAAINGGNTIRTETKKRLTQARDHGYLGYGISSPMLYLNSGEILQVLTSESYWKYFAKYFKASKSIVETKLQEIGTVRNSLAHFRPIKPEDIDLIKQNSTHVLLEVERCLTEITSISDAMPTNSKEEWYKKIKNIKNEYVAVDLFSSQDQEWIRVQLNYAIQTLNLEKYGEDFYYYKVSNLRTDKILKDFENLRKNCIFVSEYGPFGHIDADENLNSTKYVNIIFSRKKLEESSDELIADLTKISENLKKETILVLKENSAKGDLIEVKGIHPIRKNGVWEINFMGLITPLNQNDHVEFWGQRSQYVSDFIAGTDQYPWMPTTIAKPSWF